MIPIFDVTPEEARRLLQCGFACRYFSLIGTGENLDDYAYRAMRRVTIRQEMAAKSTLLVFAAIAVVGLPSLVLGTGNIFAVGFFGSVLAIVWILSLDLQTTSGARTLARASAMAKTRVVEEVAADRISIIGRVDPAEVDYVLRVMGR